MLHKSIGETYIVKNMNPQETKEFLAKLREEAEKECPIVNVENIKDDDLCWNMVKDFDEYEALNEPIMNEILKKECGLELQAASIQQIKGYTLPKYENSFSLNEKIAWLIDYIDIVDAKDLIGFKICDAGKVKYRLNGKFIQSPFILYVGKCEPISSKMYPLKEQRGGIYHMCYGDSQHWDTSKLALNEISEDFENPVEIIQGNKKYKILLNLLE